MTNSIRFFGLGGTEAAVFRQTLQGLMEFCHRQNSHLKKSAWMLIFLALIGFSFAACDDGSGGGGGGGGNQTPAAGDYTFGNLSQTAESVTAVTITPKSGKSGGARIIYYDDSTTIPQTVGKYAVTFDVEAATGWNTATGLYAGNLTVTEGDPTPVADDFIIDNLNQTEGAVTAVSITPKKDKSGGTITIYYAGTGDTMYPQSIDIPQTVGTYAVTFDVEATTGWKAETGLSAGDLVVNFKPWTAVTDSTFGTTDIRSVAYGGTAGSAMWVAGNSDGRAYSADGIGWIASTATDSQYIRSIAYGGGRWVAVGGLGYNSYSNDGITWINGGRIGGFSSNYNMGGVAYGGASGNEKFVAVVANSVAPGTNLIYYTTNYGETWTSVGSVSNLFPTFNSYGGGVAYGGDTGSEKFVAVGAAGKMAYSANGVTWTGVVDSTFGNTHIRSVAYGGGKWVAGSHDGKMAYSADGETWTAVTDSTFDTTAILGVAYGNGKWVAVGNSGKMAYSADGETWTAVNATVSIFGTTAINGVAYGGGKWVAVGTGGKMAWSDGE